jgi:hypothetical protein
VIAENQSDEPVDDNDQSEGETEIEQRDDEQERDLHISYDHGEGAAAGCGNGQGKDHGRAVSHDNFPGFDANSPGTGLFPTIGREVSFWKPQSLQRHPASVHPRME